MRGKIFLAFLMGCCLLYRPAPTQAISELPVYIRLEVTRSRSQIMHGIVPVERYHILLKRGGSCQITVFQTGKAPIEKDLSLKPKVVRHLFEGLVHRTTTILNDRSPITNLSNAPTIRVIVGYPSLKRVAEFKGITSASQRELMDYLTQSVLWKSIQELSLETANT